MTRNVTNRIKFNDIILTYICRDGCKITKEHPSLSVFIARRCLLCYLLAGGRANEGNTMHDTVIMGGSGWWYKEKSRIDSNFILLPSSILNPHKQPGSQSAKGRQPNREKSETFHQKFKFIFCLINKVEKVCNWIKFFSFTRYILRLLLTGES